MAIADILNSDRFSLGSDYNPQQSNVLGQNLAPINQLGEMAATDPSHDTRTPEQIKSDAWTFGRELTNAPDDDSNYIKSANGNKYQKVDDSDWHQGLTAAANYMSAYFASGGNVGVAAQQAGKSVSDLEAKAHRLSQVDKAEALGANPLDVQNWVDTGDQSKLNTNKGSWTSGGNGTMFNTLTGETRNIPGAVNNAVPVKTENLGDRVIEYYADGTTKERSRGISPDKQITVAGANGGGIGLDDIENGTGPQAFIQDANGGLLKLSGYNKDGSPRYTTANSKDIETYNAQQNAGTPDANTQLVNSDLAHLKGLSDEQIGQFTGHIISKNDTAQNVYAESQGKEAVANLAASHRLSTQMGNAAISAAKAAGASGINTEAELKRFTAGVPQVRYTSEADYKASLEEIQKYADNFKAELIRGKGGKTQTQHLSDEELLKKYGG